jgi:hypothetical protein
VSVFIESSGGGQSLAELLTEIEQKMPGQHDSIMRLHTVVAATLGRSLTEALSERFDRQAADQSIQYYDLSAIPAIRGQLPTGVSQVRFRVNLEHTPPVPASAFRSANPVASLLLPS